MSYPASLLRIDDEMVALGRPPPPVVAWLKSRPGRMTGKPAWDAAVAEWRQRVAAWEQEDPTRAERWVELRQAYVAEEERLEQLKQADDDEWNYTLLRRLGVPQRNLDAIRRPLDDRSCFHEAQGWLRDGTGWALVLMGGPGCGKTTAAVWAAHQLMMRSFRPAFVECPAMVDAPLFGAEAELRKRQCRDAGVLVLDDLASTARERDAKKPPAPWLDWLDNVLGYRHGNRLKTIITSNRRPDWLAGWLGERLADRLNDGGTIHETSEASMRGAR